MKDVKKILAILLVVTLMMAPMTFALAAETVEVEADGELFDANVFEEQKQVFTLPTSANFDFVLDPQGIYGMTGDAIEELDVNSDGRLGVVDGGTWTSLPTAGQIVFTKDYAPYAINESNFDAALEITFEFTETDTETTPTPTTNVAIVTEPADAMTGTANHVFIGAVFSTSNVSARPAGFSGDLALPIERATKTSLFVFEASEYDDRIEVERDSDGIATAVSVHLNDTLQLATGNGTQFMFTGACNPNPANKWVTLGIGEDIVLGIDVTYNFDEATAGQIAAAPIAGAAGLKETAYLVAGDFETLSPALGSAFAAFGFQTGTGMSGISNVPFKNAQGGVNNGKAIFSFEEGDVDEDTIIPFAFDGAALASVWICIDETDWYDVSSMFEVVPTGVLLTVAGWNTTEPGDYIVYFNLDNGSSWEITLRVTP